MIFISVTERKKKKKKNGLIITGRQREGRST